LFTQGFAGKFSAQELHQKMSQAFQLFSDREQFLSAVDAKFLAFSAHFPFGVFGCHMCQVYHRNFSVSLLVEITVYWLTLQTLQNLFWSCTSPPGETLPYQSIP
jgi:hypothetical protein